MKTSRVQDAKVGQVVRHNGTDAEIAAIVKRGATFFVTFVGSDFRTCSWGAVVNVVTDCAPCERRRAAGFASCNFHA